MVVCSTAFVTLGRSQLKALGCADLPIAVMPHPFGVRTRAQVRELAESFVDEVARLAVGAGEKTAQPDQGGADKPAAAAAISMADDLIAFNEECERRHWSDGLPLVPPTPGRVEQMLAGTRRARDEVVAHVAPGFGAASVERIAINAVMAGCRPAYLPVLIAAVEAVADARFNLQGIQATTNPVTPWLIVNGPLAATLGVNAGINCLGQGVRANATLGRALAARYCRTSAARCRARWTARRTASRASTRSAAPRTRRPIRGRRCMSSAASALQKVSSPWSARPAPSI